jgi:pimeloyl-ACP methyl ester carboxylesterase
MVIFFLHFLGGSAREWMPVVERLSGRFECAPLDLPGFGDAAEAEGYPVAEMADAVMESIRARAPASWVLAGHSMGAKVAAAVARRCEDGELAGLRGLVLLAGSPPSPEPMAESRRNEMQSWFAGDAAQSLGEARHFLESNAVSLDPRLFEAAVADVLRMKRAAWLAWLSSGSREDWSARIGVLRTPALVLAGEKDEDLGPEAQRRLMLPHFAQARLQVIAKAKHLLPLEQPDEVAQLIGYLALIESDQVSEPTRLVLLKRAAPIEGPRALNAEQLEMLRAVLQRVLPQPGIDLAERLDRQLAAGKGDGWRYAELPPDAEAYRQALNELAARGFLKLDAANQDQLLGEQGRWFEDLRADAVQIYLSHPATLARLGYSGIADPQ